MGDGAAAILGLATGLEIDVEGQAMDCLFGCDIATAEQQQDEPGRRTSKYGQSGAPMGGPETRGSGEPQRQPALRPRRLDNCPKNTLSPAHPPSLTIACVKQAEGRGAGKGSVRT